MRVLLLLSILAAHASGQGASGSGQTTRYWDCCKPSCGWSGKTNSGKYIRTCDKSDNPLSGPDTRSGCDSGGSAYMCSNQSPWAVNETVSYGWAAVKLAGSNEATWCCACYELTFTSGPVQGKKMVVQASNTGGDLGQNHFDLAVSLTGGTNIFLLGIHEKMLIIYIDARRRCWSFQRLYEPVRCSTAGMGPTVRRCVESIRLRLIPGEA